MARSRCKPKGGLHFEGGLCSTVQNEAPSDQVSSHQKWLRKPGKKPISDRGLACLDSRKVGSRKSGSTDLPVLLQPVVPGPKTQQMETHFRPQSAKCISPNKHIQNGNSGNHQSLFTERMWVTSLDFSDAHFHIPIQPRFFLNSKAYQFTALPFRLATAPLEFTKVVKEVKLMAQTRGIRIHQYLDDWLLRAPCPEICQQHTQTLLALYRDLGWVVNMRKSELVPQQDLNFVGYRFDLLTDRVLTTQERWKALQSKLLFLSRAETLAQSGSSCL